MTNVIAPNAIVAAMLARPMTHEVVTVFADKTTRRFPVRSLAQAENYAVGESRKIGRDLINRETNAVIRVIEVLIKAL